MTRRGCAAPILAQEQAFLAALRAATAYDLVGDRLTLRDGGGEVATFVRPSVQPTPGGLAPGRPP